MTVVPVREFYEWPMNNETADCEECGKEMDVPPIDDVDRDMKEPFWLKKHVHTYVGGNYDKMKAYCDDCYGDALSEVLSEEPDEARNAGDEEGGTK